MDFTGMTPQQIIEALEQAVIDANLALQDRHGFSEDSLACETLAIAQDSVASVAEMIADGY